MLNLSLLALLLTLASASFFHEVSDKPADLLFLVHTSTGAASDRALFASVAASVIEEFETSESLRVTVGSFVDKPIVHAGYGSFGGWSLVAEEDFCYKIAADFSVTNKDDIVKTILQLRTGGGLDLADGQLESIAAAAVDPKLGWRESADKYILLLTNGIPHSGDDLPARLFAEAFNKDIECVNNKTVGGFGAENPNVDVLEAWTPFTKYYAEYASIIRKEVCDGTTLTSAEESRRRFLEDHVFKGSFVPAVLPFDAHLLRSNPGAHCKTHEYPTFAQVAGIIAEEQIKVSVAVPTAQTDTIKHWTSSGCESDLHVVPIESDGTGTDVCAHQALPEACGYKAVEIMVLMDASTSWTHRSGDVPKKLADGLQALSSSYPVLRFGFASFVDKPNVYAGVGKFGGYPGELKYDWCYDLLQGMTPKEDLDMYPIILNQLSGLGLDVEEAHLEALIHSVTDTNIQWSDDEDVERVVLIVTDDVGKEGATFKPIGDRIKTFNTPVTCDGDKTIGGFGATEHASFNLVAWTPYTKEYNEYASILKEELCHNNFTKADRKAELFEILSPTSVPEILPFDKELLVSDSVTHCRDHEYPTYADVTEALTARNVSLAVLLLDLSDSSRRLEEAPKPFMQEPRHFVDDADLPIPMQKQKRLSLMSSRSASSVEDIWEWVLTDEVAMGKVRNSLISVTPVQVDSFVDQLRTIIGDVVQPCIDPPTTEGTSTLPYCEEDSTECQEGIWKSLNALQQPY